MTRRFGRNQRRAMREAISGLEGRAAMFQHMALEYQAVNRALEKDLRQAYLGAGPARSDDPPIEAFGRPLSCEITQLIRTDCVRQECLLILGVRGASEIAKVRDGLLRARLVAHQGRRWRLVSITEDIPSAGLPILKLYLQGMP